MERIASELVPGDTIRLVGDFRMVLSVGPHEDSENLMVVQTDYPAWPRIVCDPSQRFTVVTTVGAGAAVL
jgi:hypothetical protein